jgi:hypothetical protein
VVKTVPITNSTRKQQTIPDGPLESLVNYNRPTRERRKSQKKSRSDTPVFYSLVSWHCGKRPPPPPPSFFIRHTMAAEVMTLFLVRYGSTYTHRTRSLGGRESEFPHVAKSGGAAHAAAAASSKTPAHKMTRAAHTCTHARGQVNAIILSQHQRTTTNDVPRPPPASPHAV